MKDHCPGKTTHNENSCRKRCLILEPNSETMIKFPQLSCSTAPAATIMRNILGIRSAYFPVPCKLYAENIDCKPREKKSVLGLQEQVFWAKPRPLLELMSI